MVHLLRHPAFLLVPPHQLPDHCSSAYSFLARCCVCRSCELIQRRTRPCNSLNSHRESTRTCASANVTHTKICTSCCHQLRPSSFSVSACAERATNSPPADLEYDQDRCVCEFATSLSTFNLRKNQSSLEMTRLITKKSPAQQFSRIQDDSWLAASSWQCLDQLVSPRRKPGGQEKSPCCHT